jgi:hypothetical protein
MVSPRLRFKSDIRIKPEKRNARAKSNRMCEAPGCIGPGCRVSSHKATVFLVLFRPYAS